MAEELVGQYETHTGTRFADAPSRFKRHFRTHKFTAYAAHFEYEASLFLASNRSLLVLDGTATLLDTDARTPCVLANFVPRARVLFLLRQPVSLFQSAVYYTRKEGWCARTERKDACTRRDMAAYEACVAQPAAQARASCAFQLARNASRVGDTLLASRTNLVVGGIYAAFLRAWLSALGPERVHLELTEALDQPAAWAMISRFFGVPRIAPPAQGQRVNHHWRSALLNFSVPLLDELERFYQRHNQELPCMLHAVRSQRVPTVEE